MVITTSGIGRRSALLDRNIEEIKKHRKFEERWVRDSNLQEGDKVIISGTIGDHGIALLSFREGYGFESEVQSDAAPLNMMIERALEAGGIVSMKDPTRGGIANALNEIAAKSNVGIIVDEEQLPVKSAVLSACEMLGIDPLEIGNEGKVVIGVIAEKAEDVLDALRNTPEGKDARIIGEAHKEIKGVAMQTVIGGKRIIEPPIGDPIPRIC